MTLKALLAAIVAAAIAVGLALPVPHSNDKAATESQIETISVGHG